nr:hypothetical protein [Thermoanaerobaculia bacterium]
PARLQAVDIAWVDPRESASEVREMLLSLLARVKPTTRAPIRIYVDSAETALAAVCRELAFSLLAALCPIRVDSVEQALARMSEEGRVRPEILAAEGQP